REQQDALRSLGRTHVWSRREQDPAIVEVLFHAAPLHEGTAVYFGLSPVERKTPNLLGYLAEVAMRGEPNNTSRVLWGTKRYRSEMMELIVPYLRDDDRLRREIARAILRELEGGETYWRNNPMQREEDLPSQDEIREILANGTEKQLLRLMTSGL